MTEAERKLEKHRKNPAKIHLVDDTGRRVRTYYPETPSTPIEISSKEWLRIFGVPGHPATKIRICKHATLGDGATISFSFQPYFLPGHSIVGDSRTGSMLTSSHPDVPGEDRRFFEGTGPITGDFKVLRGKIVENPDDTSSCDEEDDHEKMA